MIVDTANLHPRGDPVTRTPAIATLATLCCSGLLGLGAAACSDRHTIAEPPEGTGGAHHAAGSGGAAGAASQGGHAGAGGDGGGSPGGGSPGGSGPCTPLDTGALSLVEIPAWRDGATAAYSLMHDDLCDEHLDGILENAVPALEARGLSAALAAIVGYCVERDLWDELAEVASHGHEIVSHSFTHPMEVTADNAEHEVVDAKAELDAHLPSPVTFFAFPNDRWSDGAVAAVAQAGHLGSRSGDRSDNDGFDNPPISAAEATDDFAVEFDTWPRAYSEYLGYFPEDLLTVHAYNAIERGGWAVREFHNVIDDGSDPETQGFGPIERSAYEAHLDFLVAAWQSNELWIATPSAIIRYRHARAACQASLSGSILSYDSSDPECAAFATDISVIVATENDVPSLRALQDGSEVATRKLAERSFSVTADPTAGQVALQGCAEPGPAVDPTVTVPPKPLPADSVCDIETVVGSGSPGLMDDLERAPEDFWCLPNPAQGDGRTGTWTWFPYPDGSEAELVDDGGDGVVRWTGVDLGTWANIALALLGVDGAGTCYDARAYRGIRFDIKGSVVVPPPDPDELADKVMLSVVSAQTRGRLWGGDLDGEGEHFHKQLSVTTSWQTVELVWDELDAPTWGDTVGLDAVADDELQAIDWSVSEQATSFEVYLDDIALIEQ